MNTISKATAMDGFDVWFFGGTPGPDDLLSAGTQADSSHASIDEEDARIASFAHHCDCGKLAAATKHAVRKPVLACAFC